MIGDVKSEDMFAISGILGAAIFMGISKAKKWMPSSHGRKTRENSCTYLVLIWALRKTDGKCDAKMPNLLSILHKERNANRVLNILESWRIEIARMPGYIIYIDSIST